MNKTASIFLLFLIAPFFLHAEQFNKKYIDGSEPINPNRLHYGEINQSESRPASNDLDSYIVLESPSLVGTYTGGGVGSGRGLHIIANEHFTISSLRVEKNNTIIKKFLLDELDISIKVNKISVWNINGSQHQIIDEFPLR